MKKWWTMKILTYKCPKCKDRIYSRAHYDFISCSCESISLDGGHYDADIHQFVPERLIGNLEFSEWEKISKEIDIDVSENILYSDWNYGKDKYGIIR